MELGDIKNKISQMERRISPPQYRKNISNKKFLIFKFSDDDTEHESAEEVELTKKAVQDILSKRKTLKISIPKEESELAKKALRKQNEEQKILTLYDIIHVPGTIEKFKNFVPTRKRALKPEKVSPKKEKNVHEVNCHICDETFENQKEFKNHFLDKHKNLSLLEEDPKSCRRVFPTQPKRRQVDRKPIKVHPDMYLCEVCNVRLSEKDLLKHQTNLGHFKIRPIKDVEKEKEQLGQNENMSKVGNIVNLKKITVFFSS